MTNKDDNEQHLEQKRREKQPTDDGHTLELPVEPPLSPSTTQTETPSTEDMMVHFQQTGDLSVEDFDAMIRKQLEQTGGLLAFGGADTTSSPTPEKAHDPAFDKTHSLPLEELEKASAPYAETGAISVKELEQLSFPYQATGAMDAVEAPSKEFTPKTFDFSTGEARPLEDFATPSPTPWERESVAPATPTETPLDSPLVPMNPERGMTPMEELPTTEQESEKTNADQRYLANVSELGGFLPSGDIFSQAQLDAPPLADPMIGMVVVDRYQITDLLGKGGMGKVFRATQLGLKRDVAVKMLHPQLATEKESRIRFQREAQSMTRFSHPGVAAVFDFGEWQGQYFIAMEILEGKPLSHYIPKDQGMETADVIRIMEEVCLGLAAAHNAGIVHRDLKPENIILLNESGTIKIVDFGLAMLKDTPEEERLTVEGMTIGTPHYMSPEQCQGMEVDARSDIYSLGCILYEMLCGSLPFWGDSLMAIMMQQLFAEAIPPTQRKGGVAAHPYLDALAILALAKSPEERPATVELFLEELRKAKDQGSTITRTGNMPLGNRDARASALGLPHLSGRIVRAPTRFAEVLFFVVETPLHYSDSMTMNMWSNGFTVKQIDSLQEAIGEIPLHHPGGVIVDISQSPSQLFEQLINAFGAGVFADVSVVIVGPDDSFDMMTLALEMGAFDYVPVGSTKQKLPKSLRRIAKRRAKKV